MNIEDEYVFNNKLYDIAVRDLKAIFFDILSVNNELVDSTLQQEYLDKINTLKNNMTNMVDFIKDLDSYYGRKDEKVVLPKTDNKELVNVIPEVIEQSIDKENNLDVEEKDIVSDNMEADVVDQTVDVKEDTSVVDNDISNLEVVFNKNNDDLVKAILVSDNQFDKLLKSQDEQIDEINKFNNDVDITSSVTNKEEVNKNDNSDTNNSVNMTDMAIKLYKEGKTKEAQEIMERLHNIIVNYVMI